MNAVKKYYGNERAIFNCKLLLKKDSKCIWATEASSSFSVKEDLNKKGGDFSFELL